MEILNRELYKRTEKISYPLLFIQGEDRGDFFSVTYEKKGICIRFSNPRSALFALKKIEDASKLGALFPEGEYQAKALWRVLYPESQIDSHFCMRAIEAGFNALILKDKESAELAKAHDLKVIFRTTLPPNIILPFHQDYQELLQSYIQTLPPYDALFWQSPYSACNCKDHLLEYSKLKSELYLEELQALQSRGPLFYELPEKKYLETLSLHAGPKTHIVNDSHISLVPNFNENIPILKSFGNYPDGAIITLQRDWSEGEFLECHLQAAGSSLWGINTFEDAVLAWINLYRPELSTEKPLLNALARLSEQQTLMLKAVNQDEAKMMKDTINAEIKLVQFQCQKFKKGTPLLNDIEKFLKTLIG